MSDSDARAQLIARLAELGEQDATEAALFQQAAAARYGVGVTDMKALGVLMRQGPQSAGALSAALRVTSGAVTGIVDRLITHGLARRTEDPGDRRRVVIEADLAALAGGENVYLPIGEAFSAMYAGYTTEQLEFLAAHLERSTAITRAQRERLTP